MRRSGAKYVVVAALLVSVVALSLGFAAFSNTLNISASGAVNTPGSAFKVCFSKATNACTAGSVTPTFSPTTNGPTGDNATISSDTTKITGLKATFSDRGQSVTYSFKAYNAGQLGAYLNSVAIGSKTCTANDGTTQSLVNSACNGISISVKVGSTTYNSSNNSISSHSLAVGANEDVVVTITYGSTASYADGDFTVAFGDTVLTYGTAD